MKIFDKSFIKPVIVAIALSLSLTGCSKAKDPNALPNDGLVKECSEIKVDKSVTSGISLECLGTGQQTLVQESLRGPMLVNVYGSWCWPCRMEIPHFRDFYDKYKDQVQMIGIAVEEAQKSDTTDFIKGMGIKWPSLYDPDGRTRMNIGMGVPVTIFIDAQGKIAGKIVGAVPDMQTLVEQTNKYLKLNLQ